MKNHQKAFTLTELIIAIVIVSILGTIAFISIKWYSKNARNSVRKEDIWKIKQSLEIYGIHTWFYPPPTDGVQVTYNWAEIWTQWVIWKRVIDVIDLLPKEIFDPLTSLPYTYSRLNTKTEYELAAILEDELVFNGWINLINKAYAWGQEGVAYVKWDYNWVVANVSSWSNTYILAIPTIISSDLEITDILELQSFNKLVYHEKNNLPYNYKNSQFNINWWWFIYNPGTILAYEWKVESLNDTNNQITLLGNLKRIYTWTELEHLNKTIENIIKSVMNPTCTSEESKRLASLIVKNGINNQLKVYETSWAWGPCSVNTFISDWKTDNSGVTNSNQIKLPLQNDWNYNFTVERWDWTSNIITAYNQSEVTHTYSVAWTYQVTISWEIDWFAFNKWSTWSDDLDDWDKLIDIKQWWNLKLSDWWGQFSHAENFIISAMDTPDLSNVTDMSYIFRNATSFDGNIWWWDLSNVSNLESAFRWATSFNQNIWAWDISNVIDMDNLFLWATSFDKYIWWWNVSKVTSMISMFSNATSFNQNISNWNVGNVKSMNTMFDWASSFDQNISWWDVDKVVNHSGFDNNTSPSWTAEEKPNF